MRLKKRGETILLFPRRDFGIDPWSWNVFFFGINTKVSTYQLFLEVGPFLLCFTNTFGKKSLSYIIFCSIKTEGDILSDPTALGG